MFVSYMHPLLLFISISTFLLVYACFLFSSICFLVKLPYLLFEHVIDVFSIQRLQEPRRKKDRLYSPMIFCQMPRCECSKIIGQIKSKSRPFPSFHPVHSIYIYIVLSCSIPNVGLEEADPHGCHYNQHVSNGGTLSPGAPLHLHSP